MSSIKMRSNSIRFLFHFIAKKLGSTALLRNTQKGNKNAITRISLALNSWINEWYKHMHKKKKNSSTGKTMRTQVLWHRQKKIPGLLTVNLMKFKFELLKRTSDTQCSILLSIAPARSMYACLQLLLRSLPGRNVLHPTSSRNVSP